LKVIIDVNLSAVWTKYLQGRGHEAQHWSALGEHNASDRVIMAYAAEHGAVILTGDMDFAEIHAFENSIKPSVIQIRAKDLLPPVQGPLVARALTIGASDLMLGAVVTIKGTRMRIAKLPIATTEPR
jgi:predicted nuclease of predicted toxin-antitoxin system